MKIIGLVGESGTGKSTIAEHIEKRGAGHIDADRIAHEVLRDTAVKRRIKARFGSRVFDGDEVDRERLGKLVFENPELLRALNSIVHPVIIDRCVEALARFQEAGKQLVVIDAALLLEVPVPFRIDVMIALRCDRREQIRRLVARGDASEEEVVARLDNQRHIEKAFYRADVVINTGRDKRETLREVDRVIDLLFGD